MLSDRTGWCDGEIIRASKYGYSRGRSRDVGSAHGGTFACSPWVPVSTCSGPLPREEGATKYSSGTSSYRTFSYRVAAAVLMPHLGWTGLSTYLNVQVVNKSWFRL